MIGISRPPADLARVRACPFLTRLTASSTSVKRLLQNGGGGPALTSCPVVRARAEPPRIASASRRCIGGLLLGRASGETAMLNKWLPSAQGREMISDPGTNGRDGGAS